MAGRVRELEQQLDAFRGEQANLLTHIGAAVSHAVQGGHSAGVRSSGLATPEAQLAALSSLAEARNYVAQLKECADAVREVEGAVYRAELAPAEDVEAIVRLTSEAADTYGRAAAQCAALSDHPDESTSGGGGAAAAASGGGGGGVPAPLRGREAELSQRLAACRDRLRAALGARIDAHLAECGWPPPVGGGGAAAGAQPLGQAPGAGGPPGQMVGGGGGLADALQFASPERAESVAALQRLMLALTRLQRVDERVAFEALEQSGQPLAAMAGDAAPPLWAAQQLAAPLAEQLRRQFGNAAPAGRLDRPDWLLGSVLRLANELGPAFAPQPGGPFFNPAQQQQQPQQQQPFGGAPPFDPAAAAADAAGGGGGAWGPPGGGGAASTAGASASSAGSAAATAARRLLARPISDFGGARREWTLKVAKAVAQGFLQHAQAYMAGSAAFKEADPAGAEAAVVSAGLVDALQWLQGALAALSLELDRDCFREALRSVAAAINRELFNSLVTEAAFTAAGARQLAVDVSALLLLFQPYAWKNAGGYFPETLDALALLNIADPNQLAIVKQAVAPTTRANNASDVLRSVGVKVLDADQADCVLALRM